MRSEREEDLRPADFHGGDGFGADDPAQVYEWCTLADHIDRTTCPNFEVTQLVWSFPHHIDERT